MAARDIEGKLDKVVKLLESIILPKGSKVQEPAASLRISDLHPTAKAETGKKDEAEKPRDVVTKDTPVYINGLSNETKKFFKEVFQAQTPEMKKDLAKKSSFWMELLEVLTIVILGAIFAFSSLFKKYILPFIEGLGELFRFASKGLQNIWKGLKETNIGQSIGKLLDKIFDIFRADGAIGKFFSKEGVIGKLFTEEGMIGKLFKDDTMLGKLKNAVAHLFSEDGAIGRVFSKTGRIATFLKDLKAGFDLGKEGALLRDVVGFWEKVAVWVGRLFREGGIFSKIFAFFEPLIAKAKVVGAALEKLAWPLMILVAIFDFKAGYEDEMKNGTKDTMIAKMKGAIAFFVNILTLGFVDFEDVKKSINGIVEDFKKGDFIGQLIKVVLLIPEGIGKAIYKIFTWIFSFFDKDAAAIMDKGMKEFSLSEWLAGIGEHIGEFVGEYVIAPIQQAWDGLIKFFKETIPNTFKKVIDKIAEFLVGIFDQLANINVEEIIRAVPGAGKLLDVGSWIKSKISSAATAAGTASVTGKVHQDFISRPGQPVASFSDKDTIIGAKSGGPIEQMMLNSVEVTKNIGKMTGESYARQEKLLSQNVELLKQILETLGAKQKPGSMVVISNSRQNNLTLGGPAGSTAYRAEVVS